MTRPRARRRPNKSKRTRKAALVEVLAVASLIAGAASGVVLQLRFEKHHLEDAQQQTGEPGQSKKADPADTRARTDEEYQLVAESDRLTMYILDGEKTERLAGAQVSISYADRGITRTMRFVRTGERQFKAEGNVTLPAGTTVDAVISAPGARLTRMQLIVRPSSGATRRN